MLEKLLSLLECSRRRQAESALHSGVSLHQSTNVVIDSQANRRTSSSTNPALEVAMAIRRLIGRLDSQAIKMLETLVHSAGDRDSDSNLAGRAAKGRSEDAEVEAEAEVEAQAEAEAKAA